MFTTTIRTTCRACGVTTDLAATRLVVALPPATADSTDEPEFTHLCPGCSTCARTTITWRTAAYLLESGVTAVTAPDAARLAPTYPEERPPAACPMTLDDLIDLFAELDRQSAT